MKGKIALALAVFMFATSIPLTQVRADVTTPTPVQGPEEEIPESEVPEPTPIPEINVDVSVSCECDHTDYTSSLETIKNVIDAVEEEIDWVEEDLGSIEDNIDTIVNVYQTWEEKYLDKWNTALGVDNPKTDKQGYIYSMWEYLEEVKKIQESYGDLYFEKEIRYFIELRKFIEDNTPRVTSLYSINNTIPGCYYKPQLQDIPNLEEIVYKDGSFLTVYSGYYDLDNSVSYLDYNEAYQSVYKGESGASRALEILGYDFLLSNEEYDIRTKTYTATQVGEYPTYGTVVMDIYKALGQVYYDIELKYGNDHVVVGQSPCTKDLVFGLVKEVDNRFTRTDVFVTRTNRDIYLAKAIQDMRLPLSESSVDKDRYMTAGSFIVLLADMMELYGEPVLSTSEMNLLLQVYGANIPEYLTETERDAYLYLKSRGVLAIDLDYDAPLRTSDMLDILMRVADPNSRTDWKQVQITYNLDQSLIDMGYYVKPAKFVIGDEALVLDSVSYDYSTSKYYDYYVRVDDITRFRSSSGYEISNLFIPEIPGRHNGAALSDAIYVGKVQGNDGYEYYYFRASIDYRGSGYLGHSNTIQLNSYGGSDLPANLNMEVGGGVYWYEGTSNSKGEYYLKRRDFKEGEFESSTSKERYLSALSPTEVSLGTRVFEFIFGKPIVAHALNVATSTMYMMEDSGGAKQVIGYKTSTGSDELVEFSGDYAEVKKQMSEYDANSTDQSVYNVLTQAHAGSLLVEQTALIQLGLLKPLANGEYVMWEASNPDILTIGTLYGDVTLDNKNLRIIVGNVIYCIPESVDPKFEKSSVLFKYLPKDGTQEVWIDIRAMYGWSAMLADIVVTGQQFDYTIHMTNPINGSGVTTREVSIVDSHNTSAGHTTERLLSKTGKYQVLMSAGYSTGNYIIVNHVNKTLGVNRSYVFVYYLRHAFEKTGIVPDGYDTIDEMNDEAEELMKALLGRVMTLTYDSEEDSPWVIRCFVLDPTEEVVQGKFTFNKKTGWVYNLPKEKSFTLKQYLEGNYILPLCYGTGKTTWEIVDYNVNMYGDLGYGERYRTYKSGDGYKRAVVNISGKIISKDTPIKGDGYDGAIYVAPAGVINFYRGLDLTVLKGSNIDTNVDTIRFYIGATPLENSGSGLRLKFSDTGTNVVPYSIDISKLLFYKTKSEVIYKTTKGFVVYDYYTVFGRDSTKLMAVSDGDIEITEKEDEEIYDFIESIEGSDNTFDGYTKFTLEYYIHLIDRGTSLVILIAFQIVPWLGIIGVILLLGISLVSENSLVQKLFEKTFDPVRILTFGRRSVYEITLYNTFFSCLIAFIGFALALDGNLLRLIQWLLEQYSEFSKYVSVM